MFAYMSYSRRHPGFYTLKTIRKNDDLIFLKAYHVFFFSRSSEFFAFTKNIHDVKNEPTLYVKNPSLRDDMTQYLFLQNLYQKLALLSHHQIRKESLSCSGAHHPGPSQSRTH